MNPAYVGVIVTFTIFVAGLIYNAGQMSQRVSALEKETDRMVGKIDAILKRVDEIMGLVRGKDR